MKPSLHLVFQTLFLDATVIEPEKGINNESKIESTFDQRDGGIPLGTFQRLDCSQDNGDEPVEVEWDPSIHLQMKDTNARGDVVFNIGGKNSKAKIIERSWYHFYDNL